jgi:CxxC motif-containing protein (DUF1111 family)
MALFGVLVAIGVAVVAWIVSRGDPGSPTDAVRGAELFRTEFTPEQGLGPLFNETACSGCHLEPEVGGVGPNGLKTVLRIGRLDDAGFDSMVGRGGPFAHEHAISELGVDCDRTAGIPAGANVTSVRNTPALFGSGLIDAIPDEVIRAGADEARRDGIRGRPNLVRGPGGRTRVGRFGWKADTATLERFVAETLRGELGLTSPLAPAGPLPPGLTPCEGELPDAEVDADEVAALATFVARLPAPQPRRAHPAGAEVFREAGCAACHVPTLQAGTLEVSLYSDLLLHDMGRALDDRVVQGSAGGPDWRTAPLWGLSDRTRYLHDGRADSLEAAILAHGGEAERAQRRFRSLSSEQRRNLMAFLRTR